MDKCRFKKGEIVSATKTFNGEIITGEFQGYRLFNDEIPDAVVGVVHVSGDRSYDVDVTSIRHYESEDEKIRKELMQFCDDASKSKTRVVSAEKFLEWASWLEKQKEHNFASAYATVVKEGYIVLEKKDYEKLVEQKEQKPVEWSEEDERIREALIDGVRQIRGKNSITQKQMIAWLEKQKKLKPVEIDEIIRKARSEGRQEVIDNPGYYQLVKPEEMQKPDWSEDDKNMWTHLNGYLNGFSCSEDAIKQMANWFYELRNRFNLQPKQEWSEEDELMRNRCIADLGYLIAYEPQYKERYDAQIAWLISLPLNFKM